MLHPTPEQMRQIMPMTRYWAIKRAAKQQAESFFAPVTFMFQLAADTIKVAADNLQAKFIYKKEK